MTDRDALLSAILAAPDDDLPRLVYADWLEENGHLLPPRDRRTATDRAVFIRAQVAAARAEPFSPAARAAAEQADRLLKPRREQWSESLRGRVVGSEFARGFIEHVTVDAIRFLQTADEVFDAEPVRAVRISRPGGRTAEDRVELDAVFEVPRLRQVATLELPAGFVLQHECEALAASPHLDGLTHLSLHGNPIIPAWLGGLLAGPQLPHLTGLDLSAVPNLGPALAAGLPKAGHRRFTRLNVSGVRFLSDELQRALASPCLAELDDLRLAWDWYPSPGPLTYLDLGWVIPWKRLRSLDLTGQGLGPDGVREIAQNPAAAGLRWLGLAANALGQVGAAALAAAPGLDLYHLDVRQNRLLPQDVDALRRRFPAAVVVS